MWYEYETLKSSPFCCFHELILGMYSYTLTIHRYSFYLCFHCLTLLYYDFHKTVTLSSSLSNYYQYLASLTGRKVRISVQMNLPGITDSTETCLWNMWLFKKGITKCIQYWGIMPLWGVQLWGVREGWYSSLLLS